MNFQVEPYTAKIAKLTSKIFAAIIAGGTIIISGLYMLINYFGPESLFAVVGLLVVFGLSYFISYLIIESQLIKEEKIAKGLAGDSYRDILER